MIKSATQRNGNTNTRKLRILALHSFRTNASIFEKQLRLSGLLREIENAADVTFIDAPNKASGPIPEDVASNFPNMDYFEWWNAERDSAGRWRYENAQESLDKVDEISRQCGPFDGIMGFSQGAALAALLAGMQQRSKLAASSGTSTEVERKSAAVLANQPSLRFVICFAGIKVRDPALEKYYDELGSLPSIHVVGDKDPIKYLNNKLVECFERPVVVYHDRGHVVPRLTGTKLDEFRRFLYSHHQYILQDGVVSSLPVTDSALTDGGGEGLLGKGKELAIGFEKDRKVQGRSSL
eukprot:jgi/Picsp_1/4938/NSC_02302-R1_protein